MWGLHQLLRSTAFNTIAAISRLKFIAQEAAHIHMNVDINIYIGIWESIEEYQLKISQELTIRNSFN